MKTNYNNKHTKALLSQFAIHAKQRNSVSTEPLTGHVIFGRALRMRNASVRKQSRKILSNMKETATLVPKAIKAYSRSKGTAPLIPHLCNRCRRVVTSVRSLVSHAEESTNPAGVRE